MPQPTYVILYVDDPPRSADFYAPLLGRGPVELSATFVLFVLESGLKFGLWSKHTVEPAVTRGSQPGGGAEVAMPVDGNTRVDEIHTEWRNRGLTILQPPTSMDFGYTFVALDPDGHRLRVFAPHEGS